MAFQARHQTTGVNVGGVRVGGGAPIVVQSMCKTDTADVDSTLRQCLELWQAGRLDLEGMITTRRPLDDINLAVADLRRAAGVRTVLDIAG